MSIFRSFRTGLTAVRLAVAVLLVTATAACSADNGLVLHTAKGDFAFNVEIARIPSLAKHRRSIVHPRVVTRAFGCRCPAISPAAPVGS